MTYEELRERVARDIARADGSDFAFKGYVGSIYHGEEDHYRDLAADAIRAVIEALAQEADRLDLSLVERRTIPGTYLVEEGGDVSAWLRSYLPEATP